MYAPIRINTRGLSFRLFACCRERREAEVREMEKAKLERERLEKQRAEQQVHKHFEESLRLAQQKVNHALLLILFNTHSFFIYGMLLCYHQLYCHRTHCSTDLSGYFLFPG